MAKKTNESRGPHNRPEPHHADREQSGSESKQERPLTGHTAESPNVPEHENQPHKRSPLMSPENTKQLVAIRSTHRDALPNARVVGDAAGHERIKVTIYVRRNPSAPPMAAPSEIGMYPPQWRSYMSHTELTTIYAADPADLDKVADWATSAGLSVLERSEIKRSVLVEGTVTEVSSAFGVELKTFEHPAPAGTVDELVMCGFHRTWRR